MPVGGVLTLGRSQLYLTRVVCCRPVVVLTEYLWAGGEPSELGILRRACDGTWRSARDGRFDGEVSQIGMTYVVHVKMDTIVRL